MDDSKKFISDAKRTLREYGVDADEATFHITDMGPDNISFIVDNGSRKYFIAADDALAEDDYYISDAKANGLSDPRPLKLLEEDVDGEYITMFDQFKVCKVYVSEVITK